MKHCADPNCPEINQQPLERFYPTETRKNGLPFCKTCQCRRAAERELRIQEENRIQGKPTTYHRKPQSVDYLERHEARRKEEAGLEATRLTLDHQPKQEGFYSSSPSNFLGMIDSMLRQKQKESSWRVC